MGKQIKNSIVYFVLICFTVMQSCNDKEVKLIQREAKLEQVNIALADTFFMNYSRDPFDALNKLMATNPLLCNDTAGMDTIRNRLTYILPLVGLYHGYDLITQNKVTNRYLLNSYLLYYERQVVRFNMIFYKIPNKDWKLQLIYLDTNVDEELCVTSQVYLLDNK